MCDGDFVVGRRGITPGNAEIVWVLKVSDNVASDGLAWDDVSILFDHMVVEEGIVVRQESIVMNIDEVGGGIGHGEYLCVTVAAADPNHNDRDPICSSILRGISYVID